MLKTKRKNATKSRRAFVVGRNDNNPFRLNDRTVVEKVSGFLSSDAANEFLGTLKYERDSVARGDFYIDTNGN